MAKDTRIDFTTTTERKEWLKTTAEKQEISVSQLLNRLIRNRMLQEAKHKKDKPISEQVPGQQKLTQFDRVDIDHSKTKKLGDCSREELGDDLYNALHEGDNN